MGRNKIRVFLSRVVILGVAVIVGVSTLRAQVKTNTRFHLPAQASAGDYESDHVLVKLKPEHRNLFRNIAGRTSAGIAASAGVTGSREMVPEKLVISGRTSKGPLRSRSAVDMSLYYELACDPGRDIERFINDLYQTGYFEVVEPDYVNRTTFIPNDPSRTQQYYLTNIRAYEAWDINQGSESVTIAIVDSGGDLDHPDLVANLYINAADPVDGIDNDNNGYIDDYRGWDFMGADTLNINNPNFIGDNNPQLVAGGSLSHGVFVAGCASARANNNIGMAGVGFKSKLLFTKHSADNQKTNSLSVYRGYNGVLYAASVGAQIINVSWGGSFRSEIIQDLINFVTLDLGSLVVAAAGNSNLELPFYPAGYDNVLSVAAVTQANVKASFSNYGSYIDIAAPGVNIYTTAYDDSYTSVQGTSFASPIVAGAAALVKAHFPAYTPQQIAEQLRVTSNSTLLKANNPLLPDKLGYGILDIFAALTKTSPSIRASGPKLVNASGSAAGAGEKGFLTLSFKNVLAATSSAVELSVSSVSPAVTVIKGTVKPGIIAAGSTITNALTPFEIQISATVPENFQLPLTLTYKDGEYLDKEVITFTLNPTYIDVDENQVTTTVSGTARIGYEDTQNSAKGKGFVFEQNSLLYEMGIIFGTSTSFLHNNVRGLNSAYDQDFITIQPKIKEITPGDRSTSEIFGTVSNSATPASQSYLMKYRSLAWKETPYDKFVIMEYIISNPTASPISNFHFGIFADWDITTNGAGDAAKWDNTMKLGYVYPAATAAKPYAGIQLLTGPAEYFAIDNSQTIPGNPFGLYDGYTDAEKFQSISSGLGRLEAGTSTPAGNDVSHVVSSGPYTIAAGQEIRIAFALHAASNLNDLVLSSKHADTVYNYTLPAVKPTVAEVSTCYGSTASLTAAGATSFKWYKSFTGGTPFFTGSNYVTPNLLNDTTFYVSNASNSYESVRAAARVVVKANPTITTSGSTVMCSNESITLSAAAADSYVWNTGATTRTIVVTSPGSYSVTVNSLSPACQSTSTPVVVTTNPAPTSSFVVSTTDLKTFLNVQFTDQSVGAVSWLWNFGNNSTSTDKNPTTIFTKGQPYSVQLTVTSDKGCQSNSFQTVDIITGLDDTGDQFFDIHPNPFQTNLAIALHEPARGPVDVQLTDLHGRVLYTALASGQRIEIPGANLATGIYIIRVNLNNRVITKRVVKVQ